MYFSYLAIGTQVFGSMIALGLTWSYFRERGYWKWYEYLVGLAAAAGIIFTGGQFLPYPHRDAIYLGLLVVFWIVWRVWRRNC